MGPRSPKETVPVANDNDPASGDEDEQNEEWCHLASFLFVFGILAHSSANARVKRYFWRRVQR